MKFTVWIYQNCSINKGELSLSNHKYDEETEALLRVKLHSEQEVDLSIEPLDIDYSGLVKEFQQQLAAAKKQRLLAELAKLEAA